MKKNTFTVLFSKVGVALFFLMFLLWNEGSAQSYVTTTVAQNRLGAQMNTWGVSVRQSPNGPNSLQYSIKATIYERMVIHLEEGATVAQAIAGGMEKYVNLCKDKDPSASANIQTAVATFQQFTEGLLTN